MSVLVVSFVACGPSPEAIATQTAKATAATATNVWTSIGPWAAGIFVLAIDPARPATLYAGNPIHTRLAALSQQAHQLAAAGDEAGLAAVGPVNLPVTRLFVEEIILECRQKHITRVDILGFEFEMRLFPNVLDEARAKGIDIAPKYIPAEVFDKRAVEKNQVVFHDVAFIEVTPQVVGAHGHAPAKVAVELTDFSVFYSQDSIAAAEVSLKNKKSKVVVERGQIVKVRKDAHSIVSRELLTQRWTDWIDYWAVDFNFESKREIVRVKNADPSTGSGHRSGEWEERWTGDFIFENEWQSFRTKKDRSLELTSVFHECEPGQRKLAVKVVDIFGNDTMTIVEVTI